MSSAVREVLVDTLGEAEERVRTLDRLAETGRAFQPRRPMAPNNMENTTIPPSARPPTPAAYAA